VRRSPLAAALTALALACATSGPGRGYPPLPAGLSDEAGRAVLERFAAAVEEGRWPEAHALLSARWRAAYTPSRLATDYGGAGPSGREAAERVRAALAGGTPLRREALRAALPVGPGRAAALVAEEGGWRVDALE
jgi:hypothetical protein